MSILTTAFMLGLAAGPLISGIFASYISFESPFWISGVLTIAGGVLVHSFVRETV